MYRDLWEVYRLNGTKKDMPNFVAKCRNCKKVKAEYLKFGSFVSRYRNSHLDVRRGLHVFFMGLPVQEGNIILLWSLWIG